MDKTRELGILAVAVLLAAFWLGIASIFTEINWWLRLPEFGGGFYLVLSWLLNRLRDNAGDK